VGAKLLRLPDAWAVLQWARSPLLLGLLAASLVFIYVAFSGGSSGPPGENAADAGDPAEERRAA
jgi:hypothetical protein